MLRNIFKFSTFLLLSFCILFVSGCSRIGQNVKDDNGISIQNSNAIDYNIN